MSTKPDNDPAQIQPRKRIQEAGGRKYDDHEFKGLSLFNIIGFVMLLSWCGFLSEVAIYRNFRAEKCWAIFFVFGPAVIIMGSALVASHPTYHAKSISKNTVLFYSVMGLVVTFILSYFAMKNG